MTTAPLDAPEQLLNPKAYTCPEWFEAEQKFFSRSWHLACMEFDLPDPGDFLTVNIASHPLFVFRDKGGELRAFHNLCRHRGTELVEGRGKLGSTIVCPYHRWTYGQDGRLRGLPNQAECFPDLDKAQLGLRPAAIGCFKEMVFVSPDPDVDFEAWIAPLSSLAWPHEISGANLTASDPFVYDIKCNWKVFVENALDGYHLAYLHENTLGGPLPGANVWDVHGDHMVWYSTERDMIKNRIPKFVEDQAKSSGTKTIPGATEPGYGGVYAIFPLTLVTPSPWSLTISTIRPQSAGHTVMEARTWVPNSWLGYKETPSDAPGYDKESGRISSDKWTTAPLETGDFQTEDIWVCEKMQRSLLSPQYSVGPLARGSGAETPVIHFQKTLLSQPDYPRPES